MKNRMPAIAGILLMAMAAACAPAPAQDDAEASGAMGDGSETARATGIVYDILGLDGRVVGALELRDAPRGLLVRARVEGLSAGAHGFHLHETGRCEPPFESAGGHHSPADRAHGFFSADGAHAGDLPNLYVGGESAAETEAYASGLSIGELLDEDGSALVIHAGPDDYVTDPAGAAGSRVACAAIVR